MSTAAQEIYPPIGHPYHGFTVVKARSGTVIEDERTGATATVDDTTAVCQGRTIHLTPTMYRALKQRLASGEKAG